MHIDVLSLFPRYIDGPIQESILGRAIKNGLISVSAVDIRSFSERKDRRVDDRPYGGGPGMVMMAGPVVSAIRATKKENSKVIHLSPRGKPLSPDVAKELSVCPHLILVCGHYEGIDERAIESCVDLEVSIGDYVLTNGCLAALVLIDVVARFIPGVLGHEEAASQDSFERGIFDHPQYTVPRVFEGKEVPSVLLSGDHEKIENWRKARALELTYKRRPDLIAGVFEGEGSQSSLSSLEKVVYATACFDSVVSFYNKMTGVIPEIQEGRAVFSFQGVSLCFVRVEKRAEIGMEMLFLRVLPAQYKKICSKYRAMKISQDDLKDQFLCEDPEGRSVVFYI